MDKTSLEQFNNWTGIPVLSETVSEQLKNDAFERVENETKTESTV